MIFLKQALSYNKEQRFYSFQLWNSTPIQRLSEVDEIRLSTPSAFLVPIQYFR
ncbi:hypothetical protein QFZ73_003045 [Peribacillus sp. V2I11]|nr:hypothetical protein [Peribacillus sp. V2I11]